jgi:hypothetical protein
MKQIKVSPVVYEMLAEIAKKKKDNIDSFIATLVKNEYVKIFG